MTNEMTMSDFVEKHSQKELAAILGVTPGAVHLMVKAERDIRVVFHPDGSRSAYEVKKLGKTA